MYWQYKGKPILLLGGSNDDNLFQWAGARPRLREHLDVLASVGGNYVRNTMSSRTNCYDAEGNRIGYTDEGCVYAFEKRADGTYDLARWNEEYWERLRVFLDETSAREIIVQLELWDVAAITCAGWPHHPYNPANNANYTGASTGLGEKESWSSVFWLAVTEARGQPVLRDYQERYIGRMLDLTLSYDHVLYQIDNESPLPFEVSDFWADFVHRAAAKRGKQVHVCDSRRFHEPSWGAETIFAEFRNWNNPEVHYPILRSELYTFCDISQNNGNAGQLHYDNLIWYRSKVLQHGPRPINHVKLYKWNWPTGTAYGDKEIRETPDEASRRFWRNIFGGAASVRHHRVTWFADPRGLGLTPRAQVDIKSMRMLADALDIFCTEPRNDLLGEREENEAYVLAEPGRQYAVYFTGVAGHSVKLDLAEASGDLRVRWLDIENGRWQEAGTLAGGGPVDLTAPDARPWAVVLCGE